MNIHASCVCIKNKGILIIGPSGSGKSDLTLRLIAEFGAKLVADDRVNIKASQDKLIASAPKILRGLLEVRGIGIIKIKNKLSTKIDLVIDLISTKSERLPENQNYNICDINIPLYRLNAFESSTPAKVLAALRLL